MPSRYIVKEFSNDAYYHVFNRGVNKRAIFYDDQDRCQFLKILERHLDSKNQDKKSDGLIYKKFNEHLTLLCYCLMGNHFHLLIHQKDSERGLTALMSSVCTAYVMYFNKRHKRIGPLFQSAYKASRISDDSYLLHITRYIHMNPRHYMTYRWSSLPFYLGSATPDWVHPEAILGLFEGESYRQFLEDYEMEKADLEGVKTELADQ